VNAPIRFLHSLAQALSTMALYAPGHPAAERASGTAWQALQALLAEHEEPTFYFLGSAPVFDGRAMHELAEWPWSGRLAAAGIRRLEFDRDASLEATGAFLLEVQRRFARDEEIESQPDELRYPGIRFGKVAVVDPLAAEDDAADDDDADAADDSRELALDLSDELDAVAFIFDEANRDVVARSEADAVVRILGAHLERHELPQAAAPADHDAYPQFHAINSALLAMAVATSAGIDAAGRHRIGVAVLLHDIGMARLPRDLAHVEVYTPEQRAVMEQHTVDGSRLLLGQGGRAMELAAVVAFEHHLRPDGEGYPPRRTRVAPHWASRLAGVCGAYVSLRAPRPFREAWPAGRALAYLEEGGGSVFDLEAAKGVAAMVRLAPAG
jgi:HD-GYP domain-containing protein (c-di-GMP phosphodiesterase class II)